MKRITSSNYKSDKYYRRVVSSVQAILSERDYVAPVDLFLQMNLVTPKHVEDWRFGRVAYFEAAIHCNLAVASRILRILSRHAAELHMKPSWTGYQQSGHRHIRLRFTKYKDEHLEQAYSTHFVRKTTQQASEQLVQPDASSRLAKRSALRGAG